jgi:hypothetical protein
VPGNDLGRDTAAASPAAVATPPAGSPASPSPMPAAPISAAPTVTLRVNPGPLDTSITVVPPLHGKKPTGVMALPGFGTFRFLPGELDGRRNAPAASGRGANDRIPVFRIPGARTPGPYGQESVRANEPAKARTTGAAIRTAIGSPAPAGPGAAARPASDVGNTVGSAAASGVGGASVGVPDRIATNAIGMPIHIPAGRVGGFKPAPITRMPAAMGSAVINGREAMRPGLHNAAIGGPARAMLPGVLSGSSFAPARR